MLLEKKFLKTQKKIGIFGGTFNPIHLGHLICAENAYQKLKLDKIFFLPSADPPHKKIKGLVDIRKRCRLVEYAIADNDHFSLSKIEVERKGKSYTVETIEKVRQLVGDKLTVYFLIGEDNVNEFPQWKDPERILALCRLAVLGRSGVNGSPVSNKYRRLFTYLDTPHIDISSTTIRKLCAQGKPIQYLVPAPVERYIVQHKLYKLQ